MVDPYLYPDVPVLKNKMEIKTESTLDLIEAEQSRANMMLLYFAFQTFPFSKAKNLVFMRVSMILRGGLYLFLGRL